jgi:hypothetical protein
MSDSQSEATSSGIMNAVVSTAFSVVARKRLTKRA